jgi:hypothetical protein
MATHIVDDSPEALMKMLDHATGGWNGDGSPPSMTPADDPTPEGLEEAVEMWHSATTPAERARAFHTAVTLCYPSNES